MAYNQPYDERKILGRISDGDEDAFAVFFNDHYHRLRPFVSRFFKEDDQAEDVLQEVFIRVWLNRDQLPRIENIAGWLRTVTSRTCINVLRKDLTRKKHITGLTSQEPDQAHTPEDRITADEIRQLVTRAVNDMPPSRRRIYLMSREEGLKPAEIAERLSLSVNTVRNTLVMALKEIRDFLKIRGHLISLLFLLFF